MPLHLPIPFKRAINNDPSKCVLFVGAGLSYKGVREGGGGLPDWQNLMQNMINELEELNCEESILIELEKLFEDGKNGKDERAYLKIAQKFKEELTCEQFIKFLEEKLAPPDITQSKIHQLILEINFRGIITTNIDMVFEKQGEQSEQLKPLIYPQFLNYPSAIRDDRFFAKIHGCICHTSDKYNDLILTEESYNDLRANRRYQSIMNVFFLGYSILMVGYSLKDPDFLDLIKNIRDIFGETMPTFYALMINPKENEKKENWEKEKKEWQQKKGVHIIPYDDHSELVIFFEEMLKLKEQKNLIIEESSKITITEPILSIKESFFTDSGIVENIDINGIKLEMVAIKGGTFQMGSLDKEEMKWSDECPIHTVTLNDFYIGKYQVTQEQWEVVMGSNPSYFKGTKNPVECITWYKAKEFCEKISNKAGKKYTLPSEAQWEYACRAGSTTRYYFGDDESLLGDYAWYDGDSGTHPVGERKPNKFGLYDMHGNIWEWCLDWYHYSYKDAPTDGSAWESPKGQFRVLRGGSWGPDERGCRSACRTSSHPGNCNSNIGLRLVWTPE